MWGIRKPAGAGAPTAAMLEANQRRKRVWDEIIGYSLSRERIAYGVAFSATLAAGVCGACLFYIITTRPFRVVVVERDRNGHIVQTLAPDEQRPLTNAQIEERFNNWVYHAFSVVVDAQALRRNINAAYSAVKRESPAYYALVKWHQDNEPRAAAKEYTNYVYRQTAIPAGSAGTWQVEWCEARLARDMTPVHTKRWRMSASWEFEPPDTVEKARINPDGFYIVAWDRREVVDGRYATVQRTAPGSAPDPNAPTMTVPQTCM